MIISSVEQLIGNTPLLLIPPAVHQVPNLELYAKLEMLNPFGSVKDRVARGLVSPELPALKQQQKTVVEASSGNTAKALAALAGIHGLKVKTVTNRIKIPEMRNLLQVLGAEIEELPGLSDCPDPFDPLDFSKVAASLAAQEPDRYFYTDQYFNPSNPKSHYEATGEEIVRDLGQSIDHFAACLGTSGSAMGTGKKLREHYPDINIWGVVSAAGEHIPGGRNRAELFEVGLFQHDFFAGILEGTKAQAIDGMLTLNRRLGLLAGPTSGLTYWCLTNKLRAESKNNAGIKRAVFIVCDRIEPYMSYLRSHAPQLFDRSTTSRPRVNTLTTEEVTDSPEISAEELLKNKNSYLCIDTRGNTAFRRGSVSGSINILDDIFSQLIEEGPALPRDKKICVICAVGLVSRKHAAFLRSQGYEAFSLRNGFNGIRALLT